MSSLNIIENNNYIKYNLYIIILFLVLLPHIGSSTDETEEDMAMVTAQNILAVLDGTSMPNEVVF